MINGIKLDNSVPNYAVFGNPVKHSKSPQIHTLFAGQKGIILHYQAIEVPVESFNELVKSFSEQNGKGLNITVPFKENAFSLCDALTERARVSGSVNTIWFDDQKKICGDTTDGKGLINDLTINNELELNNKTILVLGAGGSVRAIIEPLCSQNPQKIVIANRTVSKAEELAKTFSSYGNIQTSSYEDLPDESYDLIINGTSLSLNGKLPMIPETTINNTTSCYDLMYSDTETIFMKWAVAQGAAKAMDGLGMLVEQAAEAFMIWHGVMPETKPVIKLLRETKN